MSDQLILVHKTELRKKMHQKLISLTDANLRDQSLMISQQVQSFIKNWPGLWGCFKSMGTEPQIDFIQNDDFTPCFPIVVQDQIHYLKNSNHFRPSKLKVSEPQIGEPVSLESLIGIFVPSVALSISGDRLGRGRGYFDRLLAQFKKVNPKGMIIGVQFDELVLEDLPTEPHDIKVDYIITSKRQFNLNLDLISENLLHHDMPYPIRRF